MSTRELDGLKTMQAVANENLRAVTAAARLQLSRRRVDRLTERFRSYGALGLLSCKRGQVHRCLEPELACAFLHASTRFCRFHFSTDFHLWTLAGSCYTKFTVPAPSIRKQAPGFVFIMPSAIDPVH